LHDVATLDNRGVPGCVVASEEFRPAAEAQAKALGFDPAMVWVPHPIQNRTPAELERLAVKAIDAILATMRP